MLLGANVLTAPISVAVSAVAVTPVIAVASVVPVSAVVTFATVITIGAPIPPRHDHASA
jgi:hypothetical protein